MEEKTIEQVQAELEQVRSFLNAVIEEMKIEVAEITHELAIQKALNRNKDEAIKGRDINIQSLTAKIDELEQKITEQKEDESS